MSSTRPKTSNEARPDDAQSLAVTLGLRYVEVIETSWLDASLIAELPVSWAREHAMLPILADEGVALLCADPTDLEAHHYVEILTGRSLSPLVAERAVILSAIERCYYGREEGAAEFLEGLSASTASDRGAADATAAPAIAGQDLLEGADDGATPVTQLVNLILLDAVKQNASDIHFEPLGARLQVRYRVDGRLYAQSVPPAQMTSAMISRLKIMARMDIAEKRLPQDGMAQVRVGERAIDIRVSSVPVADGERLVLRLLNRDNACLPLETLGMPAEILERLARLVQLPNGMLVVSGPTGSGKTTTLYAVLSGLDPEHANILTIEDPVEYRLANIGQIQVQPKIGLTFSRGLRHVLRQDPDVVLVGETRDAETADIAIRASLTGHLVFTTLHTNDAPGAVMRLADMGVEPYLIAACLRGVLGQRLVRQLCPVCRREVPDGGGEVTRWADLLAGAPHWQAEGCKQCLDGYRGRIGLFELMECGAAFQAAIRAGELSADVLRKVAIGEGMTSLVHDGIRKVAQGVTDLAEVVGVAGE